MCCAMLLLYIQKDSYKEYAFIVSQGIGTTTDRRHFFKQMSRKRYHKTIGGGDGSLATGVTTFKYGVTQNGR